jgi:hypothetical protein
MGRIRDEVAGVTKILARHKILTKPNFLDPDAGAGDGKGGYALLGRLSGGERRST